MVLNLLIFIGFIAWWWHLASRRRDRVLALLRRWCRKQSVTLLDDTVVWRGWKRQSTAAHDGPGDKSWFWVYEFEISPDGLQRHQGRILLDTARFGRAWLSVGIGDNQLHEALSD